MFHLSGDILSSNVVGATLVIQTQAASEEEQTHLAELGFYALGTRAVNPPISLIDTYRRSLSLPVPAAAARVFSLCLSLYVNRAPSSWINTRTLNMFAPRRANSAASVHQQRRICSHLHQINIWGRSCGVVWGREPQVSCGTAAHTRALGEVIFSCILEKLEAPRPVRNVNVSSADNLLNSRKLSLRAWSVMWRMTGVRLRLGDGVASRHIFILQTRNVNTWIKTNLKLSFNQKLWQCSVFTICSYDFLQNANFAHLFFLFVFADVHNY